MLTRLPPVAPSTTRHCGDLSPPVRTKREDAIPKAAFSSRTGSL
jgi:hypothetical protein